MSILHWFVFSLTLINGIIILLVQNIKIKMDFRKKITEYEGEKDRYNYELEILKKDFEKALDELQPLQDKQQNCKRGEWCKSCNFNKECCISAYPSTLNYGTQYSYHYCTKGICQEFIERK